VWGIQTECDISHILRILDSGQRPQLKRGVSGAVENLGRLLDIGKSSGVHEFLLDFSLVKDPRQALQLIRGQTCKKTLAKILSVSSRKIVEKNTVTRSGLAWM
jgi:hypothetical protein